MELLEEEHRIQQNMLINHTSKYETLNHLLNQIVIRDDGRSLVNNPNNSENNKDLYDVNNQVNCENEIGNNYVKSEDLLADKFKEINHQIMNANTGSSNKNNNNDSMDSGNSSKKKKKFVYTKIFSFNNTNYDFNQNDNNNNHSNNLNLNITNNKNTLYLETQRETLENNQNDNHSNLIDDPKEKKNFIYEKIETSDKIEIEEIKSYEFILLDLIKFPHLLLEKLSNGRLDLYKKLTPDYLREKFSKIVELVKFTRNSCNNSQMTSSSRNNSCCNDSNNSILINNEGENSKNANSALNNNFKKIKFSNKIINDFSRKNNMNENNSYNMNLSNIGIDENFLLDLIIKDLVLITNIKYEKIERVINLLIKINYVNKNIRLREEFLFKEYPQNKKFLMDKILYIEKRIEAKYEKIKTMNFYIKKTESKLNEINRNLVTKKNELEENRNYLRNFEAEINMMRENEESLKIQIDNLNREKENVQNEFKEKLSAIEKQNKKLEEKLAKKNKKLKELNDMKKNNESYNNNSNSHSNRNNNSNFNNTFKNSNFIRGQNNHENEIQNYNQNAEEEQDMNYNNNSSRRENKRIENHKTNLNDPSSNSSINKYKRRRTNNLSNGIPNSNSNTNSNRFYASSNSSNYRNLNPNNRENSNDLREEEKNNKYSDKQYNHQNNEFIENDYANKNYNDINRDEEINISENTNEHQFKDYSRKRSSGSRKKEKESKSSNSNKFIVNNNIYTKYKYPSDNKFKTRRDVSFDSSSFGNKGYKNSYLFEEKNSEKRTIKSNSRNKNSSMSSKKSMSENLANYSRSPVNYATKSINSTKKSTHNGNKNLDINNENSDLYNNYPLSRNEYKTRDNYINKNYIDSYAPNRRINSTRILKDSEISSEYIDPELQKNLNSVGYKYKRDSGSKNKNSNTYDNSRSGSRRNSHRQNHSITSKERSVDRKFKTLTGIREYNKQKSNYDNYDKDYKKENIPNNHFDQEKNNNRNDSNNKVDFENNSNVPHTSFRRYRSPSYVNLLSKRESPENYEKDRNRYVITKSNQEENNLSFNENTNNHRDNLYNDYNRYGKEHQNKNSDVINKNIYIGKTHNNFDNEDYIYNQVNESNISNEFKRSKTSSGAAYLRKDHTNPRAKNTNYMFYNKNPERENDREYDTKSINSNKSYRHFRLDGTAKKDETHFNLQNNYKEKNILNSIQSPIKSPNRVKNLVEETKNLIYGDSNKKSNFDPNNLNANNNSILANRNFSNFSSNDFSNNSFRNNSKQRNLNFSNFNTTANSNRNYDHFSGSNNIHSNMMSLENSRRSVPINNNTEYEISKFKSLHNDDYDRILAENPNKIKQGGSDIPRHQSINERKKELPKPKEKLDYESKEKIHLLGLNYNYELTQKSRTNTNNSTQNSEKKAKINHTENILRNYKNKLFSNKNIIVNDNNYEHPTSSRFNLQNNSNAKILAESDANDFKSMKSETIYNSNIDKTIKISNDFDNVYGDDTLKYHKTSNKTANMKIGMIERLKGNYSSPRIEKNFDISNSKDFNSDLDYFSFNEKIFHLEQGCIIYKRNNFFASKNGNKISSNIFYSSEFNPLDYGFKKYFCAFDAKRNKINFTKEDNFSDKKISDIYIASITSFKIPQYTKNLVFIKQVYKKYLKNFDNIDLMDDYINKNTHFLVNLYYNNCKDKEIKFDNRLYSKQFRRELLSNNNFIVYLNLLSENTRIEIMFVEYDDFKYWINGLQELVSLKNY